eukprot:COSAG05_NODE_825_length_7106_cov_74.690881_1_plen_92_part_10
MKLTPLEMFKLKEKDARKAKQGRGEEEEEEGGRKVGKKFAEQLSGARGGDSTDGKFHYTGNNRSWALITFSQPEAAQRAIDAGANPPIPKRR